MVIKVVKNIFKQFRIFNYQNVYVLLIQRFVNEKRIIWK